jgi:hypothetical protein
MEQVDNQCRLTGIFESGYAEDSHGKDRGPRNKSQTAILSNSRIRERFRVSIKCKIESVDP